MACRHFIVTGRVQGVFYRASTCDEATRLGLIGWVRNCSDGSVELLACGEEEHLQQLERWLWQGPRHADVTGVERLDDEADEPHSFTQFSVRY